MTYFKLILDYTSFWTAKQTGAPLAGPSRIGLIINQLELTSIKQFTLTVLTLKTSEPLATVASGHTTSPEVGPEPPDSLLFTTLIGQIVFLFSC